VTERLRSLFSLSNRLQRLETCEYSSLVVFVLRWGLILIVPTVLLNSSLAGIHYAQQSDPHWRPESSRTLCSLNLKPQLVSTADILLRFSASDPRWKSRLPRPKASQDHSAKLVSLQDPEAQWSLRLARFYQDSRRSASITRAGVMLLLISVRRVVKVVKAGSSSPANSNGNRLRFLLFDGLGPGLRRLS
jgi:hypothetical protein